MLRWAGIAIAVVAGAGLLIVGGGLAASLAAGDASTYAAARPCPANVTSSTGCYIDGPMQVDQISSIVGSFNGSAYRQTLTMRLRSGDQTYTATVGPVVISAPAAGGSVGTRLWRGRVIEVTAAGQTLHTYAYPAAPPGWLPPALMVLGLGAIASAAVAILRP